MFVSTCFFGVSTPNKLAWPGVVSVHIWSFVQVRTIGGHQLILQKFDSDGRSRDIYAAWTCISVLFLKIHQAQAHRLICHSLPHFGFGIWKKKSNANYDDGWLVAQVAEQSMEGFIIGHSQRSETHFGCMTSTYHLVPKVRQCHISSHRTTILYCTMQRS